MVGLAWHHAIKRRPRMRKREGKSEQRTIKALKDSFSFFAHPHTRLADGYSVGGCAVLPCLGVGLLKRDHPGTATRVTTASDHLVDYCT